MRHLLKEYEDKFGDLDTFSIGLTPKELDARLLKALDGNAPIDMEAEYGIKAWQPGEVR